MATASKKEQDRLREREIAKQIERQKRTDAERAREKEIAKQIERQKRTDAERKKTGTSTRTTANRAAGGKSSGGGTPSASSTGTAVKASAPSIASRLKDVGKTFFANAVNPARNMGTLGITPYTPLKYGTVNTTTPLGTTETTNSVSFGARTASANPVMTTPAGTVSDIKKTTGNWLNDQIAAESVMKREARKKAREQKQEPLGFTKKRDTRMRQQQAEQWALENLDPAREEGAWQQYQAQMDGLRKNGKDGQNPVNPRMLSAAGSGDIGKYLLADKEALGYNLGNGKVGVKQPAPGDGDAPYSFDAANTEFLKHMREVDGGPRVGQVDAKSPKELKALHTVLGSGTSLEDMEREYGPYQTDAEGNITGAYKDAVAAKIDRLYGDWSEKQKADLLDGTLLYFRAENDKKDRIEKIRESGRDVIDVTDAYNDMVNSTVGNKTPGWLFDLLGTGSGEKTAGKFYFKNNPGVIINMAGDQIPVDVQNTAMEIGGAEGVTYLMNEGYGDFKVGDKIFSPEELGNYTLGVVTGGKKIPAGAAYGVGDVDRGWNNLRKPEDEKVGRGGEVYDLYYVELGRGDAYRFGDTYLESIGNGGARW